MNIELTPNTRLPTSKLEHRLEKALDSAQRYTAVFPKVKNIVVPADYPLWKGEKPLSKAFHRDNLTRVFSQKERDDPRQSAFESVAGHIFTFAVEWEECGGTLSSVVLKDPVKPLGLVVKIYSVHEVEEKTALMFVGYTVVKSPNQAVFKDSVNACLKPTARTMLYFITELEQNPFSQLLSQNRRRLSSAVVLPRTARGERFKPSFLLPTNPISHKDIGRLSRSSGCVLCGSATTSTCSACKSVQYCGRECQKDDWNNHKAFCHSIFFRIWYTVTPDRNPLAHLLEKYGPQVNDFLGCYINRFDSGDEIQEKGLSNEAVPANIYDPGEYFLIKIQREELNSPGQQHRDMLIYGLCKRFEVHMLREREPKAFEVGLAAMGDRMKMYRWAGRVGDFQWKICFDRGPDRNPPW